MSVLFPLYLFGLFAVGLPLAFHLLRKTPRGQQNFSSLMFLAPTPPRLTQRSQLDHLLLLLLRALAVILIALAFARPFQRLAALLDLSRTAGDRYVLLLDTSASMRRGDLWDQALRRAQERLAALRPQDQVAVVTFDESPNIVVAFPTSKSKKQRQQNAKVARDSVAKMAPTWNRSNIGSGLAAAADLLVAAKDKNRTDERLEIVLISDMQEGAKLDALQTYEWPESVSVSVQFVTPRSPTNAALTVLPADIMSEPNTVRVRVSNASDSESEEFQLVWRTSTGELIGEPIDVYTPPGQSRVVKAERPHVDDVNALRLLNDDAEFDNTFFTSAPLRRALRVAYIGADKSDDSNGLIYYLQRAITDSPFRTIEYDQRQPNQPLVFDSKSPPDVVVVGCNLDDAQTAQLQAYIKNGGRAFLVLQAQAKAEFLSKLLGVANLKVEEVVEQDYAMLGQINYQHPLFATFADPRFSDFTKIRFWKRRRLELASNDDKQIQVLAKFDEGDPALIEKSIGDGQLFVLASGWAPDDSQLALSTKFVPMTSWLLDRREAEKAGRQLVIGDVAQAPMEQGKHAEKVLKPNGDIVALGQDGQFMDTDLPGEYEFDWGGRTSKFAVNLPVSESLTAPLDPGVLEPYGVRLGRNETVSEKVQRQRQMQDIELESEQTYWRWFLAGALVLLAAESWLAGWYSRPMEQELTT